LILNTLVLLKDGPLAYQFALEEDKLSDEVRGDPEVKRRLDYIGGRIQP